MTRDVTLGSLTYVCERPHVYVGKPVTLDKVWLYFLGYMHGWTDTDTRPDPFEGFFEWFQARVEISHSAWGMTRMLRHAYSSDAAAIEALPTLYREFLADLAASGIEGIKRNREASLHRRYGRDWGEPDDPRPPSF